MIFHIPHSSKLIPQDVEPEILLSERDLEQEQIFMTDAYIDELFGQHALPGDETLIFPVSRLVLDPERFEDDEAEEMAAVGMGVIYTSTSDGRVLREKSTKSERSKLIATYYRPHHTHLTRVTERELSERGHALIIDCHSFPSIPLPYEKDHNAERPDICLGIDDFHTPADLVENLEEVVKDLGMTSARNSPFAGSLVPVSFYKQDRRVLSIMIEVNRKLYMDEKQGSKSPGFQDCKKNLGAVIAAARGYMGRLDLASQSASVS
jgi:N-formylglutamate deformylase